MSRNVWGALGWLMCASSHTNSQAMKDLLFAHCLSSDTISRLCPCIAPFLNITRCHICCQELNCCHHSPHYTKNCQNILHFFYIGNFAILILVSSIDTPNDGIWLPSSCRPVIMASWRAGGDIPLKLREYL